MTGPAPIDLTDTTAAAHQALTGHSVKQVSYVKNHARLAQVIQ